MRYRRWADGALRKARGAQGAEAASQPPCAALAVSTLTHGDHTRTRPCRWRCGEVVMAANWVDRGGRGGKRAFRACVQAFIATA